jgi:hypothetical protein
MTENKECNHHDCHNSSELVQCIWCGRYHCSEHSDPFKPFIFESKPEDSQNITGHPCTSYALGEYAEWYKLAIINGDDVHSEERIQSGSKISKFHAIPPIVKTPDEKNPTGCFTCNNKHGVTRCDECGDFFCGDHIKSHSCEYIKLKESNTTFFKGDTIGKPIKTPQQQSNHISKPKKERISMNMGGFLSRQGRFLILWAIFIAVFAAICILQTYGFIAMTVYFLGFPLVYLAFTIKYRRVNLGPMTVSDADTTYGRNRSHTHTVSRTRNEIVDNFGLKYGLFSIGIIFMLFPTYFITNYFSDYLIDLLIVIDTVTGVMAIILTVQRFNRAMVRVSRWSKKQNHKMHGRYERFKEW